MDELKIVYIDVDKLTPYEHNTREHAEKDIAAIKASIGRHNFRDPIGIWGPQNIIVEGHGRWEAAKELGIKRLPCIRLDDMTDAERRAYGIEHNRTAELSKWQQEELISELAQLKSEGIEVPELEFNFPDVDDFTDEFTLKDGDKESLYKMNFSLSHDQAERIRAAIRQAKASTAFDEYADPENVNEDSNAIFTVVSQWLEQRT